VPVYNGCHNGTLIFIKYVTPYRHIYTCSLLTATVWHFHPSTVKCRHMLLYTQPFKIDWSGLNMLILKWTEYCVEGNNYHARAKHKLCSNEVQQCCAVDESNRQEVMSTSLKLNIFQEFYWPTHSLGISILIFLYSNICCQIGCIQIQLLLYPLRVLWGTFQNCWYFITEHQNIQKRVKLLSECYKNMLICG